MIVHHVVTLSLLYGAFVGGCASFSLSLTKLTDSCAFIQQTYDVRADTTRPIGDYRYFRIGMLVMFSMDVCDTFLYSAQILKIVKSGGAVDYPKAVYYIGFGMIPVSWYISLSPYLHASSSMCEVLA
jgi:hypothetical protein